MPTPMPPLPSMIIFTDQFFCFCFSEEPEPCEPKSQSSFLLVSIASFRRCCYIIFFRAKEKKCKMFSVYMEIDKSKFSKKVQKNSYGFSTTTTKNHHRIIISIMWSKKNTLKIMTALWKESKGLEKNLLFMENIFFPDKKLFKNNFFSYITDAIINNNNEFCWVFLFCAWDFAV